ncbi:hypothetical protein SUGI_0034920 [Cryptomeria japonica]|nr:hypothetical protein SUGI_0034920 [Cryptomeria japonica]
MEGIKAPLAINGVDDSLLKREPSDVRRTRLGETKTVRNAVAVIAPARRGLVLVVHDDVSPSVTKKYLYSDSLCFPTMFFFYASSVCPISLRRREGAFAHSKVICSNHCIAVFVCAIRFQQERESA